LRRNREWVLAQISYYVQKAKDLGLKVSVGGEDASRADQSFVLKVAELAQQSGAERFRYADTLGTLDPFETHARISKLTSAIDLDIEIHSHDDLGMATANSIAAVLAGASHVNTTVNGLGERAGNAPLEEVVVALWRIHQIETGINMQCFPDISRLVSLASRRPISHNKSIVGEGVFTHESGLHIDGILKDPNNYENFDPIKVGRKRKLVLGKHSGIHGIKGTYNLLGIELIEGESRQLLNLIRQFSAAKKRNPNNEDLVSLYQNMRSMNLGDFADNGACRLSVQSY